MPAFAPTLASTPTPTPTPNPAAWALNPQESAVAINMAAGNFIFERTVTCDSFAVEQDFGLQHKPSYMHVCCVGDVTGLV